MKTSKKRIGRPQKESGKREFLLKAKLTAEENNQVVAMAKQLGISRSDLIKSRLLIQHRPLLINAAKLLRLLDGIGAELGRSGNNINQLARHANILSKRGMLDGEIIQAFNQHFSVYLEQHLEIQRLLRQLIRLMNG